MGGKSKGKGKNKGGGKPKPAVDSALTVLHNLAKQGDLSGMEEHGLDNVRLQYTDQLSRVPLHLAAFFGHLEVVDKILEICPESGALMAQDGFLAVHFAAQQGHLECVRSLVKAAGKTSVGRGFCYVF